MQHLWPSDQVCGIFARSWPYLVIANLVIILLRFESLVPVAQSTNVALLIS